MKILLEGREKGRKVRGGLERGGKRERREGRKEKKEGRRKEDFDHEPPVGGNRLEVLENL